MEEYIQAAEPMEKSDQEVTEERMKGIHIWEKWMNGAENSREAIRVR